VGVRAGATVLPGHQITVDDQRRLSVDDLLPSKIMHPGDADDAARGLRLGRWHADAARGVTAPL
jgi:hypothetical protein